MTTFTKTIIAGKGLEEIHFGMDRETVKAIMGDPNEIEEFSFEDSDEVLSEAWHFDELGLSMAFDKEEDWKLNTLSVNDQGFLYDGCKTLGLNRDDLLKLIEEKAWGQAEAEEYESENENENQELIAIVDKSLNFWINNGEVSEVQWGPFYNDQDEALWPEA